MSDFAKMDSADVIVNVMHFGADMSDSQALAWCVESFGGTWMQVFLDGSRPNRFGGVGFTYHRDLDRFISPQPFPSWTLDANYNWQPPTPRPQDGKRYRWDEATRTWQEILL